MKKYNLINNSLGWLIFLVAAVTYMLTLEPTASFWDCPEFIAQGYKLEVGHPPGNPMFILAARFAANFAGGDVAAVAKCVNAMSAILSAATILLLFWTITHLVKKLVVKKNDEENMTLAQYLVVMGSGVCGALAYAWSDTFWFSAVEAEVYAFSSFCTALVFWLILKWENRADDPSSDRYLILIAFIFGISLGVHLLNLLAIPAIALIFYYRKTKDSTVKGSLITLLISFALIVLILYGLEPGFIELAGYFEIFFVNTLHMGYNSGVLFYAVLLMATFAWALYELHSNKSETRKRISIIMSFVLSGMLMFTNTLWFPILLIIGMSVYIFRFAKHISPRLYSNIILSMMMIFIGFSCYALVLIRSNANLPLDENSPNSPFALTSYLSRDQYGKSPLIYGETLFSPLIDYKNGPNKYTRVVKTDKNQPNEYIDLGPERVPVYASETEMLFPRIHSGSHAKDYASILGYSSVEEIGQNVDINYNDQLYPGKKPSFGENLEFFFGYQLHHMYWRYFMWNFAGRQNDIQSKGPGDVARGNWLSGIPFLDNARLPNLDFVPDEFGSENKGHNVFFMLPLLLGLIGLLWQAFSGKKGIEQFWVVFFLFLMTGIAIVMYLNQTPSQPRERDYAYAGSFYAFAIWIGMGVAAIWKGALAIIDKKQQKQSSQTTNDTTEVYTPAYTGSKPALAMASLAALIGLLVPLQMVSQTWDDHDRSGRYCARDFGENYLQSVDKDAILFCNGDNDTFPLWYLQEVEGIRTDVRAVNLSYLSTDWYIAQMQRASYDSKPLPMFAKETTYAYGNRSMGPISGSKNPVTPDELFNNYYNEKNDKPNLCSSNVIINTNVDEAIKSKVLPLSLKDYAEDTIKIDLSRVSKVGAMAGLSYENNIGTSQLMILDLVSSSISQGWKRPVYFASTVPDSYFMGFRPYLMSTGLCNQVTPVKCNSDYPLTEKERESYSEIRCNTDKMYDIITTKYKWGGLDKAPKGSIYLDETTTRMVSTMRSSMLSLARSLCEEGMNDTNDVDSTSNDKAMKDSLMAHSADRFKKAEHILDLMQEKIPAETAPYQSTMDLMLARYYCLIYQNGNSETARKKAIDILEKATKRYAQYWIFYESMGPDDLNRGNYSEDDYRVRDGAYLLFELYREVNPSGFDNFVKKFANIEKSGKKVSQDVISILIMSENERQALLQASQGRQDTTSNGSQPVPPMNFGQDQAQAIVPKEGDAMASKEPEPKDS